LKPEGKISSDRENSSLLGFQNEESYKNDPKRNHRQEKKSPAKMMDSNGYEQKFPAL